MHPIIHMKMDCTLQRYCPHHHCQALSDRQTWKRWTSGDMHLQGERRQRLKTEGNLNELYGTRSNQLKESLSGWRQSCVHRALPKFNVRVNAPWVDEILHSAASTMQMHLLKQMQQKGFPTKKHFPLIEWFPTKPAFFTKWIPGRPRIHFLQHFATIKGSKVPTVQLLHMHSNFLCIPFNQLLTCTPTQHKKLVEHSPQALVAVDLLRKKE